MITYTSLNEAQDVAQEAAIKDRSERFVYNMGENYAISSKFRPKCKLALVVFHSLPPATAREYREWRANEWLGKSLSRF